MAVLERATYLSHKRAPHNSALQSQPYLPFCLTVSSLPFGEAPARSIPVPLRINASLFCGHFPTFSISVILCLPLLANTCHPTEESKQPTWCVVFIPAQRRPCLAIYGLAIPVERAASCCDPARDDKATAGNATSLEHVACIRTARQRHLRTPGHRVQLDRGRISKLSH